MYILLNIFIYTIFKESIKILENLLYIRNSITWSTYIEKINKIILIGPQIIKIKKYKQKNQQIKMQTINRNIILYNYYNKVCIYILYRIIKKI